MWHSDGDISVYVYNPDKSNECGDNLDTGKRLQRGVWHKMELRLQVNDASHSSYKPNGYLTFLMDDEVALQRHDFVFRNDKHGEIDTLLWSNFFGGNDSSWKPQVDTFMDFDSILVIDESRVVWREFWFWIVMAILLIILLVITIAFYYNWFRQKATS